MSNLISAALVVAGVIHLLPVTGALGAERLAALYDVDVGEPNLLILMRHRAVLFGIVGGVLVAAAFVPAWQGLALVVGWVSVLAFLALALTTAGYNARIKRVVVADVVALVCLLVASVGVALEA